MPIILAMIFFLVIAGIGSLELSRYDPASETNLPTVDAEIMAKNIFIYTSVLYQYAESNPVTQAVASTASMGSMVPLNPLFAYQMFVVNYNGQPYIINSWTSASNPRLSAENTFGQLIRDINKRYYQGNNTFWEVPVAGVNSSCNLTSYSYVEQNKLQGTLTLFNNLCTQAQAIAPVGKYVLFEPVFPND